MISHLLEMKDKCSFEDSVLISHQKAEKSQVYCRSSKKERQLSLVTCHVA
jgi:hypothetical protein